MVHPKYSPEEALKRMKLMMEYDSSKTYTENKLVVEQKQKLDEAFWAALIPIGKWLLTGWGAATAVGATAATAAAAEYSDASTDEKIKMLFAGCDKSDSSNQGNKRKTMTDVEHAKLVSLFRDSFDYQMFGVDLSFGLLGGGTDLDKLKEALNLLETKGNMGDFCAVREKFGKGKFEEKLIDELNTQELNSVISTIEVLLAKSKVGNIPIKDEETAQATWWIENFPCLQYTDSFVNPIDPQVDRYGMSYVLVNFKTNGIVKQFDVDKNGKIYIPDLSSGNHKYTGKKVTCAGESKVSVVGESIKKKKISEQADLGNIELKPIEVDMGGGENRTTTPSPDPSPRPQPSYSSCSGVYRKGCKSDVIAKVQGCLGGLTQDGKFGPKTEDKLREKFPDLNGIFRDSEVDKICAGGSEQMDPSLKPEPGSIDEL